MIEDARTRDALIHTLGNLTLITVPGNTAASNSAFIDKKPWLLTSLLALNLEVTTGNKWDRQAIYDRATAIRTEEHTSELQSLMRISYDVFCLKKKQEKK